MILTALTSGVLLEGAPVARNELVEEVVDVPVAEEAVELVVELVLAVVDAVDHRFRGHQCRDVAYLLSTDFNLKQN